MNKKRAAAQAALFLFICYPLTASKSPFIY